MSEYREELEWFVRQMRAKLSLPRNMAKSHWREANLPWLIEQLHDEVVEMDHELSVGNSQEVILECADVANRAMMIADFVRSTMPSHPSATVDERLPCGCHGTCGGHGASRAIVKTDHG